MSNSIHSANSMLINGSINNQVEEEYFEPRRLVIKQSRNDMDSFKAYLQKKGVLEFLTKSMANLMLKLPENPIEELLKDQNKKFEEKINNLQEQNQKLQQENKMLKLEVSLLKIKEMAAAK